MRYRSRQDHRLCLDCVYTWPWLSTPNRAAITQTIEAVTASSRRRGRADGRKATARFADLGSWGRSPGRPKIGDAFLNGRAHLAHGTDLAGLAPGNSRRLKKGNPPPNVRRARNKYAFPRLGLRNHENDAHIRRQASKIAGPHS